MNVWARSAAFGLLATAFLVGSTLITSGVGSAGPAAQAEEPKEHHSHLHHALHELREARNELKTADHDFGGHREEAIKAIDVAITQLEVAIKYDRH